MTIFFEREGYCTIRWLAQLDLESFIPEKGRFRKSIGRTGPKLQLHTNQLLQQHPFFLWDSIGFQLHRLYEFKQKYDRRRSLNGGATKLQDTLYDINRSYHRTFASPLLSNSFELVARYSQAGSDS